MNILGVLSTAKQQPVTTGVQPVSSHIAHTPKPEDAVKTYRDDPIVLQVLQRIKDRSTAGMKTYGVPMTRPDIGTIEWLRHAQEEALDLAIYLERIIKDLEDQALDQDWQQYLP